MNVAAGASRQPVIWKKSRRKFMNQLAAGNGRRLWPIAGAGAVLIAAGVVVFCLLTRTPPEVPPSTVPPAPAGDITTQVHQFCGKCHAYPPPESFPRSAWREQVEQGYRFFRDSPDLSMPVPPSEEVIKYYEDRAPDSLPPVKLA